MRFTTTVLSISVLLLLFPASAFCDLIPIGSCPSCFDDYHGPLQNTDSYTNVGFDVDHFFGPHLSSTDPQVATYSYQGVYGTSAQSSYSGSYSGGITENTNITALNGRNGGGFIYSSLFVQDVLAFTNVSSGSYATLTADLVSYGATNITDPSGYGSAELRYQVVVDANPSSGDAPTTCSTFYTFDVVFISGVYTRHCSLSFAIPESNFTTDFFLYMIGSSAVSNGGSSSFTGTLSVDSIELFDAVGNPETGAQIYSASGYNYNASGTPNPVPEPATFLLVGLGVVGLGVHSAAKWLRG